MASINESTHSNFNELINILNPNDFFNKLLFSELSDQDIYLLFHDINDDIHDDNYYNDNYYDDDFDSFYSGYESDSLNSDLFNDDCDSNSDYNLKNISKDDTISFSDLDLEMFNEDDDYVFITNSMLQENIIKSNSMIQTIKNNCIAIAEFFYIM